jgi:hypothetical protein
MIVPGQPRQNLARHCLKNKQSVVANICIPSYSEDDVRRIEIEDRPDKKQETLCEKRGHCSIVKPLALQAPGPEFNTQYCKK